MSDEGFIAVAVWVCKFTRWIILSPAHDTTGYNRG